MSASIVLYCSTVKIHKSLQIDCFITYEWQITVLQVTDLEFDNADLESYQQQ